VRAIYLAFYLWLGAIGNAYAADSINLQPPKFTIGGGLGMVGMLHLDYNHWVGPKTSVEFGLTPLLFLNFGVVGISQHLPLSSSASSNHNFVVSATVAGMHGIMDGLPAAGPGARIGYEWFGEGFGISFTAGAAYLIGTSVIPDARLTLWYVKR
jgi:hypothetical protein